MKFLKADQYPKFINVKDEVYKIKMVDRIPKSPKSDYGMCDNGDKVIWIRKNQSPKGLFRTFIHEVLHALEAEWDIKIKHTSIHKLELAIEALLSDNYGNV